MALQHAKRKNEIDPLYNYIDLGNIGKLEEKVIKKIMIIINDLQLSTVFSDNYNKDTRCSSVNCALKGLAERLRSS